MASPQFLINFINNNQFLTYTLYHMILAIVSVSIFNLVKKGIKTLYRKIKKRDDHLIKYEQQLINKKVRQGSAGFPHRKNTSFLYSKNPALNKRRVR